MPALSFSGVTSQGAFWELILLRRKTKTCRLRRKNPIKKGDHLRLYWKQRVPKSKKVIHLIGDATCVRVSRRLYMDFCQDNDFARSDGFKDYEEMQSWFGDPQLEGDITYDVIHFKLLPRSLSVMIHQVTEILRAYDGLDYLGSAVVISRKFWEGYLKALNDVSKEVFPEPKEMIKSE